MLSVGPMDKQGQIERSMLLPKLITQITHKHNVCIAIHMSQALRHYTATSAWMSHGIVLGYVPS